MGKNRTQEGLFREGSKGRTCGKGREHQTTMAYYIVVLKSHGLKHWHEIASGPYQTYRDADARADENNEVMFGGPLGNCYLAVRMGDRKDGRPWKIGDHIVLK